MYSRQNKGGTLWAPRPKPMEGRLNRLPTVRLKSGPGRSHCQCVPRSSPTVITRALACLRSWPSYLISKRMIIRAREHMKQAIAYVWLVSEPYLYFIKDLIAHTAPQPQPRQQTVHTFQVLCQTCFTHQKLQQLCKLQDASLDDSQ